MSVYRSLLVCVPQDCGPLDSEAMVMGVLDQSFDVLVLRYGVQKRIYCKVSFNTLNFVLFSFVVDPIRDILLTV